MLAIENRKPVLCEKPLGMNASECREMVQAARRANVAFGVAHVYRFERSTAYFRENVAAGSVGKPVWARAEFSFPARTHDRTWIHNTSIAGGGPITDVGVHCVDALRYILNDEIVRVTALSKADEASGDVEATAALALEPSKGTLASILVSSHAEYRTPFEIVGESGTLKADDAFSLEKPVEIETKREGKIIERETVSNSDAFVRQVDSFSAAVEGREQFPALAEEGWQNQEVLDAVYRSLKSGRAATVMLVR
jgi:predicted dehydrogenase